MHMLTASYPLLGNQIGEAGAKHIADALMCNSSLMQVNIGGESLSLVLSSSSFLIYFLI